MAYSTLFLYTVFRIPSDVINPSVYCPPDLYTSSGILNPVDPLALVSNILLRLQMLVLGCPALADVHITGARMTLCPCPTLH